MTLSSCRCLFSEIVELGNQKWASLIITSGESRVETLSWFVCVWFCVLLRDVASFVSLRTYLWDDKEPTSAVGKSASHPRGVGASLSMYRIQTLLLFVLDWISFGRKAVLWILVMGSGINFAGTCTLGGGNQLYTSLKRTLLFIISMYSIIPLIRMGLARGINLLRILHN